MSLKILIEECNRILKRTEESGVLIKRSIQIIKSKHIHQRGSVNAWILCMARLCICCEYVFCADNHA